MRAKREKAHDAECVCEVCHKRARAEFEREWAARRDRVRRMEAARTAIAALAPEEIDEIAGEVAGRFAIERTPEPVRALPPGKPERIARVAERAAARADNQGRAAVTKAVDRGDAVFAEGWPAIGASIGGGLATERLRDFAKQADDPLPVAPGRGRGHPAKISREAAAAWAVRNAEALARARSRSRAQRPAVAAGDDDGAGDDEDEPEPPAEMPSSGTRVRWYSGARGERLEGRVLCVEGGLVVARTDLGFEEHVAPGALQVVRPVIVLEGRQRARERARTIPIKRITRAVLRAGAEDYPDIERPRTRGDCVGEARPCPWVSCKHHLYLEVNEETGAIKLNFPDLEPDELEETCALDVADRGGVTLEVSGSLMNLTRERMRQLETRALHTLKPRLPEGLIETLWEILARRDAAEAARPENALGSYEGRQGERAVVAEAEAVEALAPEVDAGESEAA